MSFLQKLDRMTQPFGGYCGGGGGGGSSTATTSIDPDIKRRVTPALDVAQSTYEQELGIGTDGPGLGQKRYEAGRDALAPALHEQEQLAQSAIQGTGAFDDRAAVERTLANFAGDQQAKSMGQLGNARQSRANAAALGDLSLTLQDRRQDQIARGAEAQSQVAGQKAALAQKEYDVPHESLSRFFGYLGNAPQGSQTTQKQGGGK